MERWGIVMWISDLIYIGQMGVYNNTPTQCPDINPTS